MDLEEDMVRNMEFCTDASCPMKDACYRYTDGKVEGLTYYTESPFGQIEGDKCEKFMPRSFGAMRLY